MNWFRQDADAIGPNADPLTPEEHVVLEKLSSQVVKRGMTVPAIIFLESVKPLNYVGSQALVFFEPMVQSVFNFKDYDTVRSALEKRPSIEILIQKIEAADAIVYRREVVIKKFMKEEKKKWRWYQRYLGIFPPKVTIPEELLRELDAETQPPLMPPSNS